MAEEINSLLIPIGQQQVIVPQSGLAEVVARESMQPVDSGVLWLRGMMNWRGEQISVISLELLCGRDAPPLTDDSRLVVLYAIERIPGLKYYALEVTGIPHPVRIGETSLMMGGSQDAGCEAIASNVIADGDEAVFLNSTYIEAQISGVLQRL